MWPLTKRGLPQNNDWEQVAVPWTNYSALLAPFFCKEPSRKVKATAGLQDLPWQRAPTAAGGFLCREVHLDPQRWASPEAVRACSSCSAPDHAAPVEERLQGQCRRHCNVGCSRTERRKGRTAQPPAEGRRDQAWHLARGSEGRCTALFFCPFPGGETLGKQEPHFMPRGHGEGRCPAGDTTPGRRAASGGGDAAGGRRPGPEPCGGTAGGAAAVWRGTGRGTPECGEGAGGRGQQADGDGAGGAAGGAGDTARPPLPPGTRRGRCDVSCRKNKSEASAAPGAGAGSGAAARCCAEPPAAVRGQTRCPAGGGCALPVPRPHRASAPGGVPVRARLRGGSAPERRRPPGAAPRSGAAAGQRPPCPRTGPAGASPARPGLPTALPRAAAGAPPAGAGCGGQGSPRDAPGGAAVRFCRPRRLPAGSRPAWVRRGKHDRSRKRRSPAGADRVPQSRSSDEKRPPAPGSSLLPPAGGAVPGTRDGTGRDGTRGRERGRPRGPAGRRGCAARVIGAEPLSP